MYLLTRQLLRALFAPEKENRFPGTGCRRLCNSVQLSNRPINGRQRLRPFLLAVLKRILGRVWESIMARSAREETIDPSRGESRGQAARLSVACPRSKFSRAKTVACPHKISCPQLVACPQNPPCLATPHSIQRIVRHSPVSYTHLTLPTILLV